MARSKSKRGFGLGRADEVIVAARLGTQSASGGRPYSSQARFTCAIFAGGGSERGGQACYDAASGADHARSEGRHCNVIRPRVGAH
jgi:hypothetical protein